MATEREPLQTVVTHNSIGKRLKNSCGALIMSPVLIVGSLVLLIWNESHAVSLHRALRDSESKTVSVVDTSKIDRTNEGSLVHMMGTLATSDDIRDDVFSNIPPRDSHLLKLKRKVEMYQWVEDEKSEEHKKVGGSTETHTTYSYDTEWRSDVVDSHFFHDNSFENPREMPLDSFQVSADPITLDAFTLADDAGDKVGWFKDLTIPLDGLPDQYQNYPLHASSKQLYLGKNPQHPTVGDVRIRFQGVASQTVSLVAQQQGSLLTSYHSHGQSILLMEPGRVSAATLFQHAHQQATMMAWFLRLVGTILLFAGLKTLTGPAQVLADVIPFIGNLLEGATSCILFVAALVVSTVVVSISWLAVRPLISIPMLVGCVGVAWLLRKQQRETKIQEEIPEAQVIYEYGSNSALPPPQNPAYSDEKK